MRPPIVAIAWLSLKQLVRSRMLVLLALLLGAVVFLFPAGIRSDGTPEGLIRLHLSYTLGLCTFLLTIATLWAGCAAVAQETDRKTLQMILVKPAPRLQIWAGKWLALLLLNFFLLALAGGLTYAMLYLKLNRGGWSAEQISAARQTVLASLQTIQAVQPDVSAPVRQEYEALKAAGRLPDAPEAVVMAHLRQAYLTRLSSIAPGGQYTWTFDDPVLAQSGAAPLIQFRCDSSVWGAAELHLGLSVNGGEERPLHFMSGAVQTILPEAYAAGGLENPVRLTLRNPDEQNATLFFEPEDGLVLRQPYGTFAGNYLRALTQLFLRLALFAAIGVTLGTFFSLPVATFLSIALLLLLQLSGFVRSAAQVDKETFVENVATFGAAGHEHGDGGEEATDEPSWLARAAAGGIYYVYRGTYAMLRPLLDNQTLDRLTTATRIPDGDVVRDVCQQSILWPLLLAGFSTLVLRRREWGLPVHS